MSPLLVHVTSWRTNKVISLFIVQLIAQASPMPRLPRSSEFPYGGTSSFLQWSENVSSVQRRQVCLQMLLQRELANSPAIGGPPFAAIASYRVDLKIWAHIVKEAPVPLLWDQGWSRSVFPTIRRWRAWQSPQPVECRFLIQEATTGLSFRSSATLSCRYCYRSFSGLWQISDSLDKYVPCHPQGGSNNTET